MFTDERVYAERIASRLETLEKTLNEKNRLGNKVDPLIDQKIKEFVKTMPDELGPTITQTLKEQIRKQRDEVVEVLYPIMGKMIKKYVAQEIKLLSEKMDRQFDFLKLWKFRVRSWFGGGAENEQMLRELAGAQIQQVFLIEKDSGLLKAGYSKSKTIDQEMISGMLTAIKAFMEDAFEQKGQELESIEYELYEIHLQNFVSYYMAVVVSGNFSLASKNRLQDLIFDFYNRFMAMNMDLVFESDHGKQNRPSVSRERVEKELGKSFGNVRL